MKNTNMENFQNIDKGVESLIKFFNELQQEASFGANGKQFEESIKSKLINNNFITGSFDKKSGTNYIIKHTRNLTDKDLNKKDGYYDQIKRLVVNDKTNVEILSNPLKDYFNDNIYIYIYQPFGSQNFPDFLVLTKNWLIPIETKFSTKKNKKNSITKQSENLAKLNVLPKWNSNIPKANTIYLFANNEYLTFFIGNDYLSTEVRNKLIKYFDEFDEDNKLKLLKEELIKDYDNIVKNNQYYVGNPTGICPSIRIDYLTKKDFKFGLNTFEPKHNKNGIFDFSKNNKWEEHVFDFLNNLKYIDNKQ